jgi:hypothetical protein
MEQIKNILQDIQKEITSGKLGAKSIFAVLAVLTLVLFSIQMQKESLKEEANKICKGEKEIDIQHQTYNGEWKRQHERCDEFTSRYYNALGLTSHID